MRASLIPVLLGVPRYDADALALFARMTVQPTPHRKKLISNLITGLKVASIWSKFDIFYVLAAHDAQTARLNWKGNAAYDLTAVNTPIFTVDQGYQGDGATIYLDTGFNSTIPGLFSQDSAHVAIGSRTPGGSNNFDIGATNASTQLRSTGDQFLLRVNAGSSSSLANNDGSGRFIATRTASNMQKAFRNGISLGTSSVVSAAMTNATFRLLGRSGTVSFSARQQSFASFGAALDDAAAVAYDQAMAVYLSGVGAS